MKLQIVIFLLVIGSVSACSTTTTTPLQRADIAAVPASQCNSDGRFIEKLLDGDLEPGDKKRLSSEAGLHEYIRSISEDRRLKNHLKCLMQQAVA